jgi:single-strand DNA-binding protein
MTREHISDATLVGRLGQKPELGETNEGVKYARLSIATSERYTDRKGEIHESTEWTRVVAWGDLAQEVAERFEKGDAVSLTGSLRVNSYEKDGAKNRVLELHATSAASALDPSVSMNDAVLVGQVRSVESKTIPNGTAMTILSVGTNTKQNGKDREDYHSVTLWAKTAERGAKDIAAGDLISINGAVRHRSVPGPDGVQRHLSAIHCRQFQVLERTQERKQESPERPNPPEREPQTPSSPPRSRSRQRGKSVERDM